MKSMDNVIIYEPADTVDVIDLSGNKQKKAIPNGFYIQVIKFDNVFGNKCAKVDIYNDKGIIEDFSANTQRNTIPELEEQIQRIINFALFILEQRKN